MIAKNTLNKILDTDMKHTIICLKTAMEMLEYYQNILYESLSRQNKSLTFLLQFIRITIRK